MRWNAWSLGMALVVMTGCGSSKRITGPPQEATLATVVEEARVKHHLPAIAVASFSEDKIEVAVRGIRRVGEPALALEGDRFHIGSNGKAILATAIGRLVELGELSWTLTLSEAFPELASSMQPAYRGITLEQLLKHRSGLPAFASLEDFALVPQFPGDGPAQRQAFAEWILVRPPALTPGEYLYSNAGYAIAAAIAERRTGRSWDALERAEVLDPLGASVFVGWPLDERPDAPSGHIVVDGAMVPIAPSAGRIPTVFAPAGDLSLTVGDYARFAQLHLRSLSGHAALLADSTFRRLHTPTGDDAMGWQVIDQNGNTVLVHSGNSDTFYSFVLLFGGARRGFALVTNSGDSPDVQAAFAEIIQAASGVAASEAGALSVAASRRR
jgi:CubicO group peptidase (beta-lactamase class C family)